MRERQQKRLANAGGHLSGSVSSYGNRVPFTVKKIYMCIHGEAYLFKRGVWKLLGKNFGDFAQHKFKTMIMRTFVAVAKEPYFFTLVEI